MEGPSILLLLVSRGSELKQIQIFLEKVFLHAEAHSPLHLRDSAAHYRAPPELLISDVHSAHSHYVKLFHVEGGAGALLRSGFEVLNGLVLVVVTA